MLPLWDRLGELPMPARVLAGEHDRKFTALAERMVAALPGATLDAVPAAGHALPRVAPGVVAAAISARVPPA
jgi:pimeloyl-ACP methyl ester carboxylesterase